MKWPPNWEQQMWQVNGEVNLLEYRSDVDQWKKSDFWDNIEDTSTGDCESYAIGKLRRLVRLTWPIEALHLALCWVETGEYHAVLVVETPVFMSYVLDNRIAEPYPIHRMKEMQYTPHQIQAVGGQRGWREWLPTP